jgi:hypothetical protein
MLPGKNHGSAPTIYYYVRRYVLVGGILSGCYKVVLTVT